MIVPDPFPQPSESPRDGAAVKQLHPKSSKLQISSLKPLTPALLGLTIGFGFVGMSVRRALLVALICVVGCIWVVAQSQPQPPPTPVSSPVSGQNPEDAYLSPTAYANAYFGFEFEFPADAKLKPIAMPTSMDRRIQLLEMIGGAPQHAVVSISAYEYKNKNYTDAKGILRRELDQDLFVGVEELHGMAKTTIGGHQFYYFEVRRGVEQFTELAGEMNGYVLVVALKANDAAMVKELVSAFYHANFFPPQEASRHAGPNPVSYEGPAISAQRLQEIRAAAPAEHMEAGKIDGNVYRNSQIGLEYEFPKGWSIQPQGAIAPAVERYREKVSGEPLMGPRERAAVKACRRTLLSAWRTKPGADGEVPYDDFGEVTLSAMPLSCFPNIEFPEDAHDAGAIRRFVAGLSLTEPLERDMTDVRSYEAGGRPFVLSHGTIAYREEGDELSRRISVAMALTAQRGYLLIWVIAAPHDAELRPLLAAKVTFESDSADRDAAVHNDRGAGGAAPENNAQSAEPPASQPATQAGAGNSPTAATPANAPDPSAKSQAYVRPSLLRDGETMQGQQGKPVSDTKPN